MSNTKHFAKGSEKPLIPDDGKVRLYSMRFCPYAQRVHLVLEAKGIPYHTININLTEKPDWLFEANPLGKVPALELVNEPGNPFLAESLIIAEYLDEKYPDPELYPKDPLVKAQQKLLLEKFNSFTTSYYRVVWAGANRDEALDDLIKAIELYENELKHRGTTFFGGTVPNILDLSIWPWFERIHMVTSIVGEEKFKFDIERYPALVTWHALMIQEPPVGRIYIPPDTHLEFNKSRETGKPNYDLLVQ